MSNTKPMVKTHKQKIIEQLIASDEWDTSNIVNVTTCMNITYKQLIKKLFKLNHMVNKKFNRYFLKQPNRRISFFYNNETKPNNTHSHLFIRYTCFDRHKVIRLMKEYWKKIDNRKKKKFNIFDQPAFNEIASVTYGTKQHSFHKRKEKEVHNDWIKENNKWGFIS